MDRNSKLTSGYLQLNMTSNTFMIAIFGPDGSGKSTIADLLEDRLITQNRKVTRYHWRPRLLASLNKGEPGSHSAPDSLKERNNFLSIVCYIYFALDFILLRLRYRKKTGATPEVIVYERYFYDILFHPRRYKLKSFPLIARQLCKLVPRPDLIVYLTGDSTIIHNRKPELTCSEIERQIKMMQNVLPTLGNSTRHDVTVESPESICSSISQYINMD